MSCAAQRIVVGGVEISTNDFENARELLQVSGDNGDPVQDGYDENIANGNNNRNTTGVQFPPPVQTSPPTPIPIPAEATNDKPPPGGNGTPTGCPIWTPGNYNTPLGNSGFTIKDFTVGALFPNELIDYLSYTAQTRFCNLQNLAENVARPLREKFGPFRINSALRNKSSTPTGISQHITGQAFDVQFSGWSYSKYWENAQWVKDNINYDQFIFEHSSSTGLAWFHLSFNKDGNRAASERTKVMTMYRNHYDPGLKRYG